MAKYLYVNHDCNNNCVVCPFSYKTNKKAGSFNKDEEIVFYGGEPTLSTGFFKTVQDMYKEGYKNLGVLTNGRAFYYEKLCQIDIQRAYVKLFSSWEKLNDALVGEKGATYQTLTGIRNLLSMGKEVWVVIPVIKQNFANLSFTISNLHNSFGVSNFIIYLVQNSSDSIETDTFFYYNFDDEFSDYSEVAYSVIGRRFINILFSNFSPGFLPRGVTTDLFLMDNKNLFFY